MVFDWKSYDDSNVWSEWMDRKNTNKLIKMLGVTVPLVIIINYLFLEC